MNRRSNVLLLGCAVALTGISSCISKTDELDLDKDIRLDMHIAGDGISFPLGNLKKIYLDSLIDIKDNDPDALIKKIDSTQYGISMNDTIDKTTITIDPITVKVDAPDIDQFEVDFGDPLPDHVAIDRKEQNSTFTISSVDVSTINESLPTIAQSKNNNPVKVNGLPEVIEYTYETNVEYNGSEYPVSKKFEINTKEQNGGRGLIIRPDGTFEDFSFHVDPFTQNIDGVDVPVSGADVIVKGSESSYKVTNQNVEVTIPTAVTDCGFVYSDFPEDVEKINYITFVDENAAEASPLMGQLIRFDIDLSDVDAIFYSPSYFIKTLEIQFPDEFVLAKDPSYQFSCSIVNNSKLIIENVQLPVALRSDKTVDPAHPTKIPVSFYLVRADLNQGPDGGSGSVMTYEGMVTYNATFDIGGIPNLIGSADICMNMSLNEKINMKDLSVTTKRKSLSFETGKISSTIKIDGLEDVSRVNTITFNKEKSKIFLNISDPNVLPFNIDQSDIQIVFPTFYHFDSSCTDLSGRMSMGSWTGNTLTLSPEAIGNTAVLRLMSIDVNQNVNSDNSISIDNDIDYSGAVSIAPKSGITLQDLNVLGDKNCNIAVWGKLDPSKADVETDVIDTQISDSTSIGICEKVDDALILVKSVELQQNADISFKIRFCGVPSGVDHLIMKSFVLEFPAFIDLSYTGNDRRIKLVGHSVTIDGRISEEELDADGNGFSIRGLHIVGMTFNEPLRTIEKVDGKYLQINDGEVSYHGTVRVENSSVSSDELDAISIFPSVVIGDMKIKSLVGKVYPKIDPISEAVSLDLDNDMDFLKDDKNNLSLSDPQILLNLTTTVSVPINLDLNVSSKKKDGNYIERNVKPDNGIFGIPACPVNQTSNTTTIVLYKNSNRVIPESKDSVFVLVSDLSKLMRTIPDSIIFNLKATADTSMTDVAYYHFVDITKELAVSGSYNVSVPLKFDSLYLEYNDTIQELHKDLKDFSDKIDSVRVQLVADVYSTIPMGVTVSATPLDLRGNTILPEFININNCRIAAGLGDGNNPVKSRMILDFAIKNKALDQLDALIITAACQADETEGGVALRSDEYLEIKNVRLNIIGGIDVDFSDKDDDNE